MKPRRYQLSKEATAIVFRDQPWIFRDHLSSAATVFNDGDWLKLVDGKNTVIGYAIYDAEGAIAIRIVRRGDKKPDATWLKGVLKKALEKRATLSKRTNATRLVHGESDGLPGVVVDRFGDVLVAQSYTRGADALARFAAIALANELKIKHVMLRPALRRKGEEQPARVLRGKPPAVVAIKEDGIEYAVDLASGQKSGTYLDLRALRRALATGFAEVKQLPPPPVEVAKVKPDKHRGVADPSQGTTRAPKVVAKPAAAKAVPTARLLTPVKFDRVLNLFAYSGMLGRAAEQAGATEITDVDASETALAFAKAHHAKNAAHHTYVAADIFKWLPDLAAKEMYDVVIVDPPAMTSNKQQVPAVLAGYKKLYRAAAPHVKPGGLIVVACCTSRVERALFRSTAASVLSDDFAKVLDIAPEADHPVAFPQADYLKIEVWRRNE
ncbi:MAG TPA: class I SAM-dependent methyltransferase [Kofleriaceae bacterium]|jgi:23S rRNA (cytosine1962-C5)-methyltransferase